MLFCRLVCLNASLELGKLECFLWGHAFAVTYKDCVPLANYGDRLINDK